MHRCRRRRPTSMLVSCTARLPATCNTPTRSAPETLGTSSVWVIYRPDRLSRMSVVGQLPECFFLLRIDNFIAFSVNKRRRAREAQKSAVVVRRTRPLQFSAGHGVDELDMQKVFLALKRDGIASLPILIGIGKRIGYRLSRVRIGVDVALLEGDDVFRICQDVGQYPTFVRHQKFFELMVAILFFCRDIGSKDQVIPELDTGPIPVVYELLLREIRPTTVDVARPVSGHVQILPADGHPCLPEGNGLRRCEEVFVLLTKEYVTSPGPPRAYRPG